MSSMYDRRKWCSEVDDVPKGEHFAIIEFDSIWVPGDERSRTHPGHGYPEHTEPKVNYIVFADEKAWREDIAERVNPRFGTDRKNWIPVHVRPATVTTKVDVSVDARF